ncbi:MAG: iron dicitrate transport regulator FecR [Desulfuromonadales bacterium]|nr:MAG: iron dicitrate transport regulator FecR [Desulfuromonadales bacterium]
MKIIRVFIVVFLFLVPGLSLAAQPREAELGEVVGEVFVKYDDVDDWVAADRGMPMTEGDQIQVVEGGRVEVKLRGGALVRLDEQGALDVLALEKGFAQFYLVAGDLYVSFPGGKRASLEVETPVASVRASSRSSFRVSLAEEGDALQVAVMAGVVDVESVRGQWRVAAGKSLYLEDSYDEFSPLDPPDEWDSWNRDRDRQDKGKTYGDRM